MSLRASARRGTRPFADGALLAGLAAALLLQHGCYLFCGKSKVTFQNRCRFASRHDCYVDGARIGTAVALGETDFDVAAGTHALEQRHPCATCYLTTGCPDADVIVPRCSEITHLCTD